MNADSKQAELDLLPDVERCQHRLGFVSMACVPAGVVCCQCDALMLQYIPRPPEVLGYESADWKMLHLRSSASICG